MSGAIRILVADDHPVVRDGLAAMLSTQPDFEVVGQAANGEATVAQVMELRPDVVLLDLEMPEMDGVAAIRLLHETRPQTRLIAFTAFDTDERILGALRAGVHGYLLKGTPREELFNAVRVVFAGGSLLQPVVATRLLEQFSRHERIGGSGPAVPPSLTPREQEVLHLLARGLQNKELAVQLGISERTVKFHVTSLFAKLGASNRTEAVALAARQGLVRR